ncbi:hypothetical protein VTI74DRAFT_1580 [Chaetomium olivicolor]
MNPGLKSFFYEVTEPEDDPWSCIIGDYGGRRHFQPSQAIAHLLQHSTTLEYLHLDLRYRGSHGYGSDDGWFDVQPLSETQTTLAQFPVLKHLFLSASAIYNNNARNPHSIPTDDGRDDNFLTRLLPPNVESLCLAGPIHKSVEARMVRALVYLARAIRRGEQVKALKRVKCDVKMVKDGLMEGYGLAEAFEDAGVNFGLEQWEVSGPAVRFGEGSPEPEYMDDEEEEGLSTDFYESEDYSEL